MTVVVLSFVTAAVVVTVVVVGASKAAIDFKTLTIFSTNFCF